MLFTRTAHAGLADGSTTVTFRRWKRAQAKVGGVYRIGPVDLTVDRIDRVSIDCITDRDARRSGFDGRDALVAYLGPPRPGAADGGSSSSEDLVWRIDFHCEPAAPTAAPSGRLTADDIEGLRGRLDRLDAAATTGPWTRAVLELIAKRPGVVSTELAAELGRERAAFKVDVRKLKRLGLTESLEVGYRLSPRGTALLGRFG